ncbi:LptF/LptG family permease [Leptospira santarosai]|uniref:LptF/LptG family permease n=1 Tax=Leptospira santarosai TaxID=28183 RepID=UPI0024AEC13E|nr:LptF/LptG family permease [Leptospira santarosai]MDI7223909.1 LptF/LptG family permease [Leptospira santarosai]
MFSIPFQPHSLKNFFRKWKQELIPPKILDRYLFGEFFKIFIGTVILLTGIMLLSLVNDNMRNFTTTKAPRYHVALFLIYSLPKIISTTVISMSLMFSICFTVGQFSVNKELVSMMAAGVSFFRIVTPLILFGILMWIVMFLATEFIVRPINKLAKIEHDTLTEGMGTLANSVYQFHVKGKEGFYYLYFYDPDKDEINGGFNYIRLRPDGSPETVISSLKAKYNYETKLWKMKKVEEWHFDNDLKLGSQESFEEKEYELPEDPAYFKVPAGSVEEMNLFQLKEEEKRRIQKGLSYGDVLTEKHSVFALPMMTIIVTLIGTIAGYFTKKTAGVASLGITIGVVLIYYIFNSAGKSLGENGVIPPFVGVWITPSLFLGLCFWMFRRMNL